MQFVDVVLEHAPCPLGCRDADTIVLKGRDRLHGLPGEFNVVRCGGCGLMRTNPRPTPETIGFYYPEDYGPYLTTTVLPGKDLRSSALKDRARELLRLNLNAVPPLPAGRMLEVGCASGAFLHVMARKGWQVQGIEFSEAAASRGRKLGYPVYAGQLETAPSPREPFDLVVGWMVLEHLHNPVKALSQVHAWTRPDGWLALSIPNLDSRQFALFGNAWFPLHLPNHLFHFTRDSLVRVLKAGGWKVERILYHRDVSQLIASLGHKLQDMRRPPSCADKIAQFPDWQGKLLLPLYPLSSLFALLRQSSAMTVWARREDD
ncbi:MAG: class I SAM-dependent methyltransferase [Pyrinomonadaceae bacterium]|nr:class I SAM-dependent methyltransferase [Pyrinomonadaceae bacterium]